MPDEAALDDVDLRPHAAKPPDEDPQGEAAVVDDEYPDPAQGRTSHPPRSAERAANLLTQSRRSIATSSSSTAVEWIEFTRSPFGSLRGCDATPPVKRAIATEPDSHAGAVEVVTNLVVSSNYRRTDNRRTRE
jgi:hypothetical protein